MTLNNKFTIGDIVYLITDPDQLQRIVTGIMVRKSQLIYQVSCGVDEHGHYEFELSFEKNVLI